MVIPEGELLQLQLMDERLSGFLDGTVPIDRVVADVEGALDALEQTPETWRRAFREDWVTLEVAYAVALSESTPALPNASTPELREAAERMLAMVEERTLG